MCVCSSWMVSKETQFIHRTGITMVKQNHNITLQIRMLYVHTYIHTYSTYVCTYIHTYIRTYIHIYIHTYIHSYLYTYIHTYNIIHTYIHTYICQYHTYICNTEGGIIHPPCISSTYNSNKYTFTSPCLPFQFPKWNALRQTIRDTQS